MKLREVGILVEIDFIECMKYVRQFIKESYTKYWTSYPKECSYFNKLNCIYNNLNAKSRYLLTVHTLFDNSILYIYISLWICLILSLFSNILTHLYALSIWLELGQSQIKHSWKKYKMNRNSVMTKIVPLI